MSRKASEPILGVQLLAETLAMKKFTTMQTGLEELTEKAQRQGTEAAAQVKEKMGEAVSKALRITEAAWYDAKTKASELQPACEFYIREKPGQSLLIALGIGFLIGLLARR
jgi:ElaB/YqjD/DUF883 family membrane-anchored ribosome-binding protein